MYAAALTENMDSHCSKDTDTCISNHTPSQSVLLVSFLTAQKSNETKQVILKI